MTALMWLCAALVASASGEARRGPALRPIQRAVREHAVRGEHAAQKSRAAAVSPGGSEHATMTGFELSACIAADLCPHGMLPLAWAASQGGGTGAVPALALIAVFGGASAYTLWLSALIAQKSGKSSTALSTVWAAANLPAPKLVDALVATLCAGCCVFYAAFAADLFGALLPFSRPAVLAGLGAVVAPLCLGDDLSVLKYSSYAGLVGAFYTASLLGWRGLQTVPAAAAKAAPGLFRVGSGTAVLANTLVVAYLCHYNALQYYNELEPNAGQRHAAPKRYGAVALRSIVLTSIVFSLSLFGGRAAFGESAMPNVLNNLGGDVVSSLAKLGTGVAILSGFPLMFAGLKAALDGVTAFGAPGSRRGTHVSLLVAFGAAAAVATDEDIGLVIELLGSTLGCAAVYIVPGLAAWMSSSAVIPDAHRNAGGCVAAAGAVLAVFGTALTLKTHFNAHH
ncbi:transmembrane amino acid transporter protein-domain-containing protein [Pelagophyceae sp. CCMP2097]|nr:transmembrane amino acid transporter protein-domain-containing protein [Pelagophyceae sp. CCMP2097]